MQRLLPYYSLLSIVFLIGCIQAFFVGVPKTIKSHPIIRHLLTHPDQSALLVIQNDSVVLERNIDTPLPLASISKIVIAIVYAEVVDAGKLDSEQLIDISALERFDIDDENYANWKALGEKEGWLDQQKVPLKYIAQGAVRLSASTNADFLIDLIGIDIINQWLKDHALDQHQPIFPFNASAILAHNSQQLKQEDLGLQQYAQELLQTYDGNKLYRYINDNIDKPAVQDWMEEHLEQVRQAQQSQLLAQHLAKGSPDLQDAIWQVLQSPKHPKALQQLKQLLSE